MPFCPSCKCEYVEGIIRCSDCDVDLVEKLPKEPEEGYRIDPPIKLVTIKAFGDYLQAELVKLHLEASGIECFLANETLLRTGRPLFPGAAVGAGIINVEVQVKAEDVECAIEVLNQQQD